MDNIKNMSQKEHIFAINYKKCGDYTTYSPQN